MAIAYKVLGQTADASSEVALYTVPASASTKAKITVTNRAGTAATFRMSVSPGGGATANEDYLAYDQSIGANDSLTSTTITLEATDVVRVQSSTSTVTFVAFGIEQT